MPVVDTSLLVAAFDVDHPEHDRARRTIGAPGTLQITGGVLAELTTVLRRRGKEAGLDGARIARDALLRLEALDGFRHSCEHDAPAVSRMFQSNPALSYVDAWGIALAIEKREDLLTLDTRQRAIYERERA